MGRQEDRRSFFVVLADEQGSAALLDTTRLTGFLRLDHPSGRPWIVGRLDPAEVLRVSSGSLSVAVIGEFALSADELRTIVSRHRTRPDHARLRDEVGAGQFHLVVRDEDEVSVSGTASGSRLVHLTRKTGRSVMASRSDVLAALHGFQVDETGVALRLLVNAPYPLDRHGVWRHVSMVAPGDSVAVRHRDPSAAVSRTWWEPPPAERGLDEGSTRLLEELRRAVDVRGGAPGRRLSADLSGGFDSTSLCFLAAESGRDFTTYTVHDGRDTDDDVLSRAAAADLPRSTAVWQHVDELSDEYAHLPDRIPWAEEPDEVFLSHHRIHDTVTALGHTGPAVHMSGDGGDNLTRPGHSYCHDLIRTRPLRALGHVRGLRHTARWSLTAVARQLWDNQPYGAWLEQAASLLHDHGRDVGVPDFAWGHRPTLPPWASAATTDLVTTTLRGAARTHPPLATARSRHVERHAMFRTAGVVRHVDQVTELADVRLSAPFTDDRVFGAALAVRLDERFDPWSFKILLRRAMRGVVPDYVLRRTTKTVVPGDARLRTVRRRQDRILDLLHGSELQRMGMIDENALRGQLSGATVRGVLATHLPATVATEAWLRRVRRPGRPDTPFTGHTESP